MRKLPLPLVDPGAVRELAQEAAHRPPPAFVRFSIPFDHPHAKAWLDLAAACATKQEHASGLMVQRNAVPRTDEAIYRALRAVGIDDEQVRKHLGVDGSTATVASYGLSLLSAAGMIFGGPEMAKVIEDELLPRAEQALRP
jgi:hypothetical protein